MHGTGMRQPGLRPIDAVAISLCVLAALAWYLTTARPLMTQRSVTAQRRRASQDQQQKAAELKEGIARVKERLSLVRREQAAGAIQLDSTARINKRIAGLTQFFSECHLEVDDVQTGRTSANARYHLVPITIVGRGPYRECVKFFHGLSVKCPDMSVMRIDITGNPAQPADPETFRFELFWYAAPGNPAPNAALEKHAAAPSLPTQGYQL